ncbi:MAG: HAD family phosphatase [Pseudomonadota bacterium]
MIYQAAIFDMDGLLLDTERLMLEAGLKAGADLGLDLPESFFRSTVGVDRVTTLQMLDARINGRVSLETMDTHWNNVFIAFTEKEVPTKPGAEDLLRALQGFGVPMAVATNSATENAHRRLGLAGLYDFFDAMVGFDQVADPKPAPDVYLEAARRVGAAPAKCIAFEDSDHGAEAAQKAGMTVVQVPDLLPSEGRWADHLGRDLVTGARAAGLTI